MDSVIRFENVSKKYRIGRSRYRSLREDISYGFKKIFSPKREDDTTDFIWALKDVSFEVKQGEALGIIGPNGAGKTTILKLLSRVTLPTKGEILVRGKTAALIEIGAGLHPELTGRENIYQYGSIMGIRRKEINRRFDSIVNFSGLEQFIDTPVKRYSAGMYVRLAFSVIAHIDFDILLIDEVLAVGDISFQKKCLDRIKSVRKAGKTIIFVSHNMTAVQGLCERVIFLNKGKIVQDGKPEQAIRAYYEMSTLEQSKEIETVKESTLRHGTFSAEITKVKILNQNFKEVDTIKSGERTIIQIIAKFNEQIEKPIFGIVLYNNEGLYIYAINTKWLSFEFPQILPKGKKLTVNFIQNLFLAPGLYYVTSAISDFSGTLIFDWQEKAASFWITSDRKFEGLVNLNTSITYE